MELAERGERARDHRSALETDERRDPPGREGALDLVGGRRQDERFGMARDEPMDDVELLDRHPERLELRQGGRHPDRPELAANASGAEPRDVRVEALDVAAKVDARGPQAHPLAQGDREVVVAVDERRVSQDRASAGYERIRRVEPVAQDDLPATPVDSIVNMRPSRWAKSHGSIEGGSMRMVVSAVQTWLR